MHVDHAADDRDHPDVAGGVHTKEAKEADRVADYLVVVRAGARAEEDDRAAAVSSQLQEATNSSTAQRSRSICESFACWELT
ncbi:hypothetical protein KIN20_028447 [Parelaphostrongylus tenuis]|uniref:Uncharacterized protein n=1 Tax=Parelaphostrongylus tenuis TaxID=148309 RepID=A0AAD5R0Z1_PARTN|nr:hypothetical protein KIN20_028447 [Parelaphostrongylus tenuis]